MSQFKLLEEIAKKLTEKNIPYMLTGSLVSSLQGIPRSTHDIDIIISIKNIDINKLIEAFSKENYYLDKKTIEEAISRKSLFNVLSLDEGDTCDKLSCYSKYFSNLFKLEFQPSTIPLFSISSNWA